MLPLSLCFVFPLFLSHSNSQSYATIEIHRFVASLLEETMKGWLRKTSNNKMLCDCKTTQTYALVSPIQPIQLHRHTSVRPIPVISSDRISQTGCQPVKIAYYKFACVLPIVFFLWCLYFATRIRAHIHTFVSISMLWPMKKKELIAGWMAVVALKSMVIIEALIEFSTIRNANRWRVVFSPNANERSGLNK